MGSISSDVKAFVGGAFALIAIYLVLAHSGGFAKDIGAIGTGASTDFKTLQGR
jgi:hypothetical protein